jgi:hypothetical protein
MYKRIVEMLTDIVDVDKDGILTYEELRASGMCVIWVYMCMCRCVCVYVCVYMHVCKWNFDV